MFHIIVFSLLIAAVAAAFGAASKTKYTNGSLYRVMDELGLYVDRSPAQVAFFMFCAASAIAAGIIASALFQVSNQLILTLDILFLLSNLLLILFHQLKDYCVTSL
jgi:hypothetical protein